jgi:hypothetical protein
MMIRMNTTASDAAGSADTPGRSLNRLGTDRTVQSITKLT